MRERLAKALLRRVYYPVTAVICMGKRERLLAVELFDSMFGTTEKLVPLGTRHVSLICSHPNGSLELTREEAENCRRIAAQAPRARAEVYIYGEDIGLIKMDGCRWRPDDTFEDVS